mgnify:CR=1 FL=1
MARNFINQAVEGQERTGVERLRDSGRLTYRAATYQAPTGNDGVSQALLQFGQTSVQTYGSYKKVMADRADERSNEIIRKLTPEQRREAIANGSLLYQDDPDAMIALRFKTGRNAAYEVESEIRNKIAEGAFKTPQEMAEYRATRLEDKAKAYAEASGIDSADRDYQRGFNADIVDRERAAYDAHGQKLSEQRMAMAQMETTSDLGSMMSDPEFLYGSGASKQFANYFTASLASGSIPTEGMAVAALGQALKDNVGQPGAEVFMQDLGDQEIVLYGKSVKIRDVIGNEVIDNLKVKANESAFKRNRETNEGFSQGLQDAIYQGDPNQGLIMLAGMQSKLNRMQPGELVTKQSEEIIAARGQLLSRIRQDSVERQKAMDKLTQADNRLNSFEVAYGARIQGENISTDWRTFATNPNTGEFKEEDGANFAAKKLSQIDQMSLSEPERDALKLKYLRADFESGPFRKHFQTLTSDAVNQFAGLVAADSAEITESNTARIREFQRIYQSDPATLASLYPEQAALAERISLMESHGLGLETIIDSDRKAKGLSIEEKRLQDNAWMEVLKSTKSSVAYLPGPLRNAARTLFDAEVYRTGDEKNAFNTVNEWLDKSTVQFITGDDKRVGALQKRTLMVDPQDATSWRQGRDIVNEMVREIAKSRPWINEGNITIQETPNGIILQDPSSSINLPPITSDYLRQHYELQQENARAEAEAQRQEAGGEKIQKYKQEAERRKASPFGGLDPSTGTLEGAAGFKDR